jgi:hypothetical protein
MVEVNNVSLDIHNINQNDFSSNDGGVVIDAFLLEGEGLILVQEVVNNHLKWFFFNATNLKVVSKEERYRAYNGKIEEENIEDYLLVSEIKVDLETGAESIDEKIIYKDNIVYQCERFRYETPITLPLFERYQALNKSNEKSNLYFDEEILNFKKMKFEQKVTFLRGKFRQLYKTRWELGILPEECFLSEEEVERYSEDEYFTKALNAMLKLEESFTGKPTSEMFANIIAKGGK